MTSNSYTTSSDTELNILRGALENTNEAFITIDKDSMVIFFNKAAEQIFGYKRNEMIGKNLVSILGPDCREGHINAVSKYVKTQKSKLIGHETEFVAMRKNGDSFPASISFSVSKINDQFFFTGIVRDITKTKVLHEKIIRSERLAALGQTVAEISHEIKNPLALIGGLAKQLIKSTYTEKEKNKLNAIITEVRRLENFLLELNELYTPKGLTFEKIIVLELLREIYSLVETECCNKNINISLRAKDKDIIVKGDREKLKQVLINILKNSVEALAEGDTITIDTEATGKFVTLAITDSGPGIPSDIKDKIFSPFFTTKQQGTGLGLSISRRIINDHPESSLKIKSQEKKGTSVKIILPRLT